MGSQGYVVRFLGILILLCHFLYPVALRATASGPAVLSVDQWQRDLIFLVETVSNKHRSPFEQVSEKEIHEMADRLKQRIPSLSDSQIIVELAALVALLKDGHSRLSLPVVGREVTEQAHIKTGPPLKKELLFHRFPVQFYQFSDGLFIRSSTRKHRDLIGCEVIRLENKSPLEALQAVRRVVNADNEMGVKNIGPAFLGLAEVCNACDISRNTEKLSLVVQDAAGVERKVDLPALASDRVVEWVAPWDRTDHSPAMWQKNLEKAYWYQYLPDHRTVYCQVNHIINEPRESISEFCRALSDFINGNDVRRLILDLRMNGGGNNYLNRSLILALVRNKKINCFGKLFTLIGRHTFSAAMNLASLLEIWTNTIFCGEPTGATPSHFGDARKYKLPNSGLTLRLSSIYWRDWSVDEGRRWISPEIKYAMDSTAFFSGEDPLLDMVIAFDPPEDLAGRLLWLFDEKGFSAAYHYFYRFTTDPLNTGVDIEPELRTVGHGLIKREKYGEAVNVFKQNIYSHPDSVQARLDLAELFLKMKKRNQALYHIKKALELQSDNPRANIILKKLEYE